MDFPATADKRKSHWTLSGGEDALMLKVDTGSGDVAIIRVM